MSKHHLPSNLLKSEVYDYYKTDMLRGRVGDSTKVVFPISDFLWRPYYPLVGIPKHNTFNGCDVYEQTKHDRDSEPPGPKKDGQSLVYDYIDNSRVKRALPVDTVAINLYLVPKKRRT
ncbi:hypothetical protein R1sor_014617 [Riccia sorocarpa]|uniref:Uncharacterized protein n=1 Tax=Riccia sorocarpa TaxID=122646 RepID=A0ABD3H9X0_9MARC